MKSLTLVAVCLLAPSVAIILCGGSPLERAQLKVDLATEFDLWPENIELLGGRFYLGSRKGRLPEWFNFTLYKKIYNKNYLQPDEDKRHHIKYIETCAETLRRRVLFRILGDSHDHYIDANSDTVS